MALDSVVTRYNHYYPFIHSPFVSTIASLHSDGILKVFKCSLHIKIFRLVSDWHIL